MVVIFDKIREILYKEFSFHHDQIQLQTKLELELGMDSREMLEFLSQLEKIFKITINFDEIDQLMEKNEILTVQTMVDYINLKVSN
jgi:acyl carrier protein